jgi:hypothetical protein
MSNYNYNNDERRGYTNNNNNSYQNPVRFPKIQEESRSNMTISQMSETVRQNDNVKLPFIDKNEQRQQDISKFY